MDYNWETQIYGNKSGSRIFVPVNTTYRNSVFKIKKGNWVYDLEFTSGFKDIDLLSIEVPAGFEIESIPQSSKTESDYGYFISDIVKSENRIQVRQTLHLKKGRYSAENHTQFIAFIEKVNSGYSGKITLRAQ